MTTGLRLLHAGLTHATHRLEQWSRAEAIRAAKLLDAAARSAEPGMRNAYLTSLRKLRQSIQEADLAAVMESGGSAEHLIDLIPWDKVAAGPMRAAWTAILLDLVAQAGAIAADALPSTVAANLVQGGERAADWARSHAANMVTAVTDGQRVAIRDTVARVFAGADEDRLTPAQAAQVIRSTVGLTPKLNQAVLNLRDELVDQGRTQPQVDSGVRKYGDKLRAYRAQAIATTETIDAANVAQQAKWQEASAQGLIPPSQVARVWNVIEDDRLDLVVCAPMDGQRVGLNDYFITGDGRQILTPTAHPFCLTGDSVVFARGITATTQRWYEGDIIVIRTAGGQELCCTPNHPVLSPLGWLPAERLHEVGYVIASGGMKRMATATDHHGYDTPASIQEIAETFWISSSMASARVPVAAEHFHGDGSGSQVAVIRTDRMLGGGFDTAYPEFPSQFALEMRDAGPKALSSLGGLTQLGHRLRAPRRRQMCRRDLTAPGHRCHLRPLQQFGSGSATDLDASRLQGLPNRSAADAVIVRELINGSAGPVVADKLIEIRRHPFRGHVFNLETQRGWYVAQGIVTHNCRCFLTIELA